MNNYIFIAISFIFINLFTFSDAFAEQIADLTFEVPHGWEKVADEDATMETYRLANNPVGGPEVKLYYDNSEGGSIDQYLKFLFSISGIDLSRRLELERLKLKGIEMEKVEQSWSKGTIEKSPLEGYTVAQTPYQSLAYYFVGNQGRIYSVQLEGAAEDFDSHLPAFEILVQSLQLVGLEEMATVIDLGDFTITPPADWKVLLQEDNIHDFRTVLAPSSGEITTFMALGFRMTDETLDEFAEGFRDGFLASDFAEGRVLMDRKVINGIDMLRFVMMPGSYYNEVAYFFIRDGKVYYLIYGAENEDKFVAYEPVFKSVVNSITQIKGGLLQ